MSAVVSVKCPKCGRELSIPKDKVFAKGRCKNCGKLFVAADFLEKKALPKKGGKRDPYENFHSFGYWFSRGLGVWGLVYGVIFALSLLALLSGKKEKSTTEEENPFQKRVEETEEIIRERNDEIAELRRTGKHEEAAELADSIYIFSKRLEQETAMALEYEEERKKKGFWDVVLLILVPIGIGGAAGYFVSDFNGSGPKSVTTRGHKIQIRTETFRDDKTLGQHMCIIYAFAISSLLVGAFFFFLSSFLRGDLF